MNEVVWTEEEAVNANYENMYDIYVASWLEEVKIVMIGEVSSGESVAQQS